MSTPSLEKIRHGSRWRFVAMLVGTFVLKFVVLEQLKDHPLLAPDSGLDTTAYVELARKVLSGNLGLGPGLYYVSPFYIYFLATLLGVFRSYTAVRVVQILLGTATVGFVFLMARRWFGERAAWIAAILASLTGLLTFYEVLILQSSVDGFFTAAALWALSAGLASVPAAERHERIVAGPKRAGTPKGVPLVSESRGSLLFFLLAGVIWGLQTLNRPNVLLAALGVAASMVVVSRRIKPAGLLVAGLLVGMAPVAIRNVVVSGEWTLVSSHGGLNFYIGNNADATGFYRPVPGVRPAIAGQEADTRRIAAQALGHPVTDAEASSYFFGLGRTWVREHPADALGLFVKKFAFTFHAAHVPLPQSYPFFAYDTPGILRFLAVGPWLLTPLGLLGLAIGRRKVAGTFPGKVPATYWVWAGFVPLYAGAVALFFVADRYRLPLMVPLCVGAGGAADGAIAMIAVARANGRLAQGLRSLFLPATAFAALFAATNAPAALDDGRWTEGLRTAERLVIAQRYDEAERWAAWLDTHHPPHAGAGQLGVAQQLMALDQHERALPYLTRAHQADPAEPHAAYALGQALLKLARAGEAVAHLRQGFDAGIELPLGGADYARALVDTGNAAGAVAALRRIHPSSDAQAEEWLRLGRLAMEAQAPDVAEPFFQRAATMQPTDAAVRQQFGLNLLVLGRFEDAARELTEASRLDPLDADSRSHLAYAEAKLGRMDAARGHTSDALALNPGDQLAQQLALALRAR